MNGETKSVHAGAANRDLLKIGFLTFGRITVSLPLGSLIFCFFSAIIFQFEAVNETVCHVSPGCHSEISVNRFTSGFLITLLALFLSNIIMGKKSINVWCPAFIALKNDSSIYFDTESGFSLGPGKHKNAVYSQCT